MTVDEKIDRLTNAIEKMAIAPVAPVAVVAPVAPVLPVAPINNQDHDTLTGVVITLNSLDKKLDDKFSDLKNDIKNISDGTTAKISDHEDRIRRMEHSIWIVAGALTALTFIIPIINKLFFK